MKKIDDEALMANVLVKLGIDFPTVIFRPKYSEKLQRLVIFVNIGNKKIRVYRAGGCYAVGAKSDDKLRAKPCASYYDMQVYIYRILREWGMI